jgi:hypothetical protein
MYVFDFTIYNNLHNNKSAKMKKTNIYDGAVMIFLNDPLVIMLWETWIEKPSQP